MKSVFTNNLVFGWILASSLLGGGALYAEQPVVEIATTGDSIHQGRLLKLSGEGLVLQQGKESKTFPLDSLLEIGFSESSSGLNKSPTAELTLVDGSTISFSQLTFDARRARIESPSLGVVGIDRTRISTVRFQAINAALGSRWEELQTRSPSKDRLVVKKGEVLNFIPGIVAGFE